VSGTTSVNTPLIKASSSAGLSLQDDGGNGIFIEDGGQVGIGTTNPGAKLEVFQDLDTSSGASILKVTNTRVDTGSSSSVISLITDEVDGGTTDERVQLAGSYDGTNGGKLDILTNNGLSLSPAVTIKHNGNVGIGTTNPGGTLELSSTSTDANLYMGGTPAVGTREPWRIQSEGDFLHIGQNKSSFAKYMTFKSGNVGIGTTNPSGPLDVVASNGAVTVSTNGHITSKQTLDVATAGGRFVGSSSRGVLGRIQIEQATTGADGGYICFGTSAHGSTSPTERMRINSAGNVGIGTTNPSQPLDVNGWVKSSVGFLGSSGRMTLETDGVYISTNGQDAPIKFAPGTASTEKMRIDSGGNVGIGTTNPSGKFEVKGGTSYFEGISLSPSSGSLSEINSGSSVYGIQFKRGSFNTMIIKGNNVGIGTTSPDFPLEVKISSSTWASRIYNTGSDVNASGLLVRTDATAAHDTHAFGIYADGGYKFSVRSNGYVGIGTTSPAQKLDVYGNIAINGTTIHSSDDRVKHNEQSIVNALETLSKITPKKYIKTTEMYDVDHDFELDSDGNPIDENGESVEHRIEAGVIAQQVSTVDELAFAVTPEGVDEDGNATSPHGLDYNSLFTYAIAAIQEQQTIIEDLKARIETLES